MKRTITRTHDDQYCTMFIELKNGRLSVTGEEGRVVTPNEARAEAINYWKSFFDDMPEEIAAMNSRCGTHCRSSLSAAKYVTRVDGQYHGLDAREMDDGKVFILQSCGCIHETLEKWFPEAKPLLTWHLNDMRAGCEHQEKLGWGHGFTVALTKHTLTDAQRETIDNDTRLACENLRNRMFKERWENILTIPAEAHKAVKAVRGNDVVTISDLEELTKSQVQVFPNRRIVRQVKEWLVNEVAKMVPIKQFDAAIYNDSIGAPCPECGYKYGTQWLKRDLPQEIIELAETVCTNKG